VSAAVRADPIEVLPGTEITISTDYANLGGITIDAGTSSDLPGHLKVAAGVTLTNPSGQTVQALWHYLYGTGRFTNLGTVDNWGLLYANIENKGVVYNRPGGTASSLFNEGVFHNLGDQTLGNVWADNAAFGQFINYSGVTFCVGENGGFGGGALQFHDSASGTNHGILNVRNAAGFEMQGPGTAFLNSSTGLINLSSAPAPGHMVFNGGILTNNGAINNNSANLYLWSGAIAGTGTYTQSGAAAYAEVNGNLTQAAIDIQSGMLAGTGILTATAGPVTIGPSAVVSPGSSPGTLTIDGDLDLSGTYLVEVNSANPGDFDVLNVTGTLTLDGTSVLNMRFAYQPSLHEAYDVLLANEIVGAFDANNIYVDVPAGGGEDEGFAILSAASSNGFEFSFDVVANPSGGVMLRATVTAVPEPSALGLAAVAGVLAIRRRRRG
jgi:MYXO-CTERM domain-containing protein